MEFLAIAQWLRALWAAASSIGIIGGADGPTSVFVTSAAAPADSIPHVVVVTTGLVLVFAILVLLVAIVTVQGKVFSSLGKNKKAPDKAAPPPAAAKAAAPAPAVAAGIAPEVVAAIAAAVAAASDGAHVLRSVSASKKGRGQWGLAGVLQSTEPF